MSGLNITVSNATNLVNLEVLGKSDPYTLIEFQGQKKKTKEINDNLNPQWDEQLAFDLGGSALNPGDVLMVKVMDKEKIGPDKLMGFVEVPLKDLAGGKTEVQLNLNLMDKNKRATTGALNLKIQYQPPKGAPGAGGAPAPAAQQTGGGGGGGVDQTDAEDEGDETDFQTVDPISGKINLGGKKVGKRKGRKTYSTKPQDFQIRVKIVEARQLQGGNISPVCKVKCRNLTKQTKVKNSTGSPVWNSSFFFNFHLSASELFDEIISFEIFNSRKLRSDALIGSFKFDLNMIYEESNHAYINKWLLLSDPDDTNSGAKGYLKFCACILGPGDEAPNFTATNKEDDQDIESNLIRPAGIQLRPATFALKVYQAEDLPIMDSSTMEGIKQVFTGSSTKELVDPYMVVSFAGKEIKTSTKYANDHPDWNEELKIPLQFPSMCDRLKLQIYDWDRVGNNDAVGTHYVNLSNVASMREENGFLPTFGPCFINFYGSPREFSDLPDKFEALNLGKGDGCAYRGRVLLELTTQLNETSENITSISPISEEVLARVSKFLRRRKYRLHAAFMSANMIKISDAPIEFEVSMGNYGNKMEESVPASSSCTQPTNAVFDGSYYYFLPWGDAKPCSIVECHWEDISCRLFSMNFFLRIADKLTKNIEKIKVAKDANIPEEEQAQFVISAFDELIISLSKPMPTWEPGQSPETELDKFVKIIRDTEMKQMVVDAMKIRTEATSVAQTIQDLEAFVCQIKNLAIEPQNSMPDIIIWMISGGKRKHYVRIPANDLIWSDNEDYRGRFCGILQNLSMKSPILIEEKDDKDLLISAQLRLKIWLGQEKEEHQWHAMQKEGKLTVMAETYENQASLLGKWTTKSPLMIRPSWSDASGKVKLPKEKINPPTGWVWDGDWFISPEMSLYFDKNALLTEFMEDIFVCEMRIVGGSWGPATVQYCNIRGDPCPGPNEITLPEDWTWVDQWKVDFNRPCDEEGWEYAIDQSLGAYQPVEKMYHMSRRRRHVRQRKLVPKKDAKGKERKKEIKASSEDDEHWEYAPVFDMKFHAHERKIDMVRRRRWHRKMISTKPGAPCFFNLGAEEGDDEEKKQEKAKKTTMTAPRMYIKYEKSYKYQMRAYIFQARDLLAADQNGFSDPYARVVFGNQSQVTEIHKKEICPTWDQTLIFKEIELYGDPVSMRDYPPKVVIEIFDFDQLGEDEFLGRCEAFPMVKLQANDPRRAVLQWFPIKKGSRDGGELLAAFEVYLIGDIELPFFPPRQNQNFIIPDGIRPMMQRTAVEVLTWGVRNMKQFQLLSVNSPSAEFEIGGNVLETDMIKNVRKNPNFITPFLFFDVLLPKEELYMPPINIKIRDHRAFGRKPIVGTHCLRTTEQYRCPALAEDHDGLLDFPELLDPPSKQVAKPAVKPAVKPAPKSNASSTLKIPDLDSIFKGKKKPKVNQAKIDEDIDWWSKYYASLGQADKCSTYLELGYDTLNIYKRPLEESEDFDQFIDFCSTFFLSRGSNDQGEDEEDDSVGEFKGTFRIYPLPEDRSEKLPVRYLKSENLPSSDIVDCMIRVYIIKAYDLQPSDPSGLADPYIKLVLGREKKDSKAEYIPNSLTPEFGKMFEVKAIIPVMKDLHISIMDYDFVGKDDVIGETMIDLENRYLTKFRATCGLPLTYNILGPNQWRDAQTPTAILNDFCVKNRLPTPEFVDDNTLNIGKKQFLLSQFEGETEPHINLGPSRERLALHILNKLPLVKEHIEIRPLYSPLQPGIEQGKIEMWVDIHPLALGPPGPPFNICPRKAKKFEIRVVVRNTYDVKLDEENLLGERMSDIYVKGWINGLNEKQETDVHYRSLDGEGNFNWRFIFPFDYIPSENCLVVKKKEHFWSLDKTEERLPCKLIFQIWDNDKFSADDFLGTLEMDLCAIPSPAKKKEKCTLEILPEFCKDIELLNLFDCKRVMGLWPVYDNSTGVPELTGKLELEIDLLTEEEATLRPAGCSRDDPNENPHLDPPNRPATSFFWFTSPWKTFKFIVWRNMKYYLLTGLLIVLLVLLVILFVYAIPGLTARKMFNV